MTVCSPSLCHLFLLPPSFSFTPFSLFQSLHLNMNLQDSRLARHSYVRSHFISDHISSQYLILKEFIYISSQYLILKESIHFISISYSSIHFISISCSSIHFISISYFHSLCRHLYSSHSFSRSPPSSQSTAADEFAFKEEPMNIRVGDVTTVSS